MCSNKAKIYILLLFTVLLFVKCQYQKTDLPTSSITETSFGANDTNYVELNPIWDASHLGIQLSHPADIAMGPDGYLFVADEGNNRIVVLSRSGEIKSEDGLGDLTLLHPIGISVDSKLNVLMVNGSDTLFGWNQYLNLVSIDSVSDQALCFDPQTQSQIILSLDSLIQIALRGDPLPYLIKILFEKDNTRATAARAKSPVYVSEDPESSFNGVSAGPFSSELIYLTESSFDKIIMVYLVPDLFIKTTSGEVLYHYHGIYMADIATRGSGAGTVDDPWSITADEDGYIYFTQFKGNFFVQKLGALDHETPYVLYQHDIMDLNRFIKPYDITLDDAGQIFVMDTGAGKVLKFANSGTHAGNQINLGKKGLATTVFEDARSILVKEDIVYIVESGLNRIRRFQYSISDSDLPDDEQGP